MCFSFHLYSHVSPICLSQDVIGHPLFEYLVVFLQAVPFTALAISIASFSVLHRIREESLGFRSTKYLVMVLISFFMIWKVPAIGKTGESNTFRPLAVQAVPNAADYSPSVLFFEAVSAPL